MIQAGGADTRALPPGGLENVIKIAERPRHLGAGNPKIYLTITMPNDFCDALA